MAPSEIISEWMPSSRLSMQKGEDGVGRPGAQLETVSVLHERSRMPSDSVFDLSYPGGGKFDKRGIHGHEP